MRAKILLMKSLKTQDITVYGCASISQTSTYYLRSVLTILKSYNDELAFKDRHYINIEHFEG